VSGVSKSELLGKWLAAPSLFDTKSWALIKYGSLKQFGFSLLAPGNIEDLVVSLVKIIVITIIVILSILLFGRFFV